MRWQYQDIIPDYQLGATSCAVFLSLRLKSVTCCCGAHSPCKTVGWPLLTNRGAARRFHLLKPEYIYHRIKQLHKSYNLRIILCYVDVDDVVEALGQVRTSKPHGTNC